MSMTALFLAVAMTPAGGMNVKVEADGLNGTFAIDPPNRIEVKGERHPCLPPKTKTPFWAKECRFKAAYNPQFLASWAVDPGTVAIFADGRRLERKRDYDFDEQWGGIHRLDTATVGGDKPITIDYVYRMRRLDSVVRTADGKLVLRTGAPHVVIPEPPALAAGETRVGNVFVDAQCSRSSIRRRRWPSPRSRPPRSSYPAHGRSSTRASRSPCSPGAIR